MLTACSQVGVTGVARLTGGDTVGVGWLNHKAKKEAFVARFAEKNSMLWWHRVASKNAQMTSVTKVDGGVIVGGITEGAASLGGVEIDALGVEQTSFVARLDEGGSVLWLRTFPDVKPELITVASGRVLVVNRGLGPLGADKITVLVSLSLDGAPVHSEKLHEIFDPYYRSRYYFASGPGGIFAARVSQSGTPPTESSDISRWEGDGLFPFSSISILPAYDKLDTFSAKIEAMTVRSDGGVDVVGNYASPSSGIFEVNSKPVGNTQMIGLFLLRLAPDGSSKKLRLHLTYPTTSFGRAIAASDSATAVLLEDFDGKWRLGRMDDEGDWPAFLTVSPGVVGLATEGDDFWVYGSSNGLAIENKKLKIQSAKSGFLVRMHPGDWP